MNLVRLTVRPHHLEQVLICLAPFEMDALTIRQVRGLETMNPLHSQPIMGMNQDFDFEIEMNVELDLYVDERIADRLFGPLLRMIDGFGPSGGKIYRLHCDSETTIPMKSQHPD